MSADTPRTEADLASLLSGASIHERFSPETLARFLAGHGLVEPDGMVREAPCPTCGRDCPHGRLPTGDLRPIDAALPAPERSGLDVADLGLSDEQTDILRVLLASRQQTVSQWLGDVLMDWHGLVEQTVRRLKDYRDGEALAAVRTVKPSEADRA